MNVSNLKTIIVEQNSYFPRDRLIPREKFVQVVQWHREPAIVVISGLRRCGKSTLLYQLRQQFEGYYLNFDDERLVSFTIEDFQKVDEIFHELYGEHQVYYFDEVQNVTGWERFVRRLHDFGKKVYITGSNARLLSSELGTHLTGRYLECRLYPFSFREFLQFKDIGVAATDFHTTSGRAKLKRAFNDYFTSGGLPEFLKTGNKEYIKTLYESILYRDVLVRNKIANEIAMRELMLFVFSNIGKPISFNKIKNMIGLKNPTTVKDYFQFLGNSFLVFLLPKLSPSLKKSIYSDKKVYTIDVSFAHHLGFRLSDDLGRFLENIVFIELMRREKEVYYFQEKYECDFVVREGTSVIQAIQVCYELNPNNREREYKGLLNVMRSFRLKESILLTYDQEDEASIEGYRIRILPVWKWLLNE